MDTAIKTIALLVMASFKESTIHNELNVYNAPSEKEIY